MLNWAVRSTRQKNTDNSARGEDENKTNNKNIPFSAE